MLIQEHVLVGKITVIVSDPCGELLTAIRKVLISQLSNTELSQVMKAISANDRLIKIMFLHE